MYANTSQCDPAADEHSVSHQRVSASAAVSFKLVNDRTRLDRLYQNGSAKVRFPNNQSRDIEAVLINTAGGLTGGDQLNWDLRLAENTEVVATTQACEKAYLANDGAACLSTQAHLGAGSTLHWLPQETILYEGSALTRTFDVTMQENATLLAIESTILGRQAMGEAIRNVLFRDRWRIRYGGKLWFADDIKLSGNEISVAQMKNCRAVSSLLLVCGGDDEELQRMVRKLREISPAELTGFSAFNGKIVGRILAKDSYELRKVLAPVLRFLRNNELPRVWRI
ncbi:MAG: urease accessory protein UreD [Pseudomonadota bacterium]